MNAGGSDSIPSIHSLSDEELTVLRQGGYGVSRELGDRPCLILVDFQKDVLGDDLPILEQLHEYPSGVGNAAWSAVRRIVPVLESARTAKIPIVHTQLARQAAFGSDISLYGGRIARAKRDLDGIVECVAPKTDELVIRKHYASAFFGTVLASALTSQCVDTVWLAGGSTSGCIRATAVDAASSGFQVVVIEDGVFDRIKLSHDASLLDIWMKYGALRSSQDARDYFESRS